MRMQSKTVKTLAGSAALVASLGLGAVLGSPGVAQAQEDTTTTVVADSTDATTATTIADNAGDDTTTPDRPTRGDQNCDHAATDATTASA